VRGPIGLDLCDPVRAAGIAWLWAAEILARSIFVMVSASVYHDGPETVESRPGVFLSPDLLVVILAGRRFSGSAAEAVWCRLA